MGVPAMAFRGGARDIAAFEERGLGKHMEKPPTFILQTTRAGRLPTNALFTDETAARAEADRAKGSGAFEHIRLVHQQGSEKTTLLELGKPSAASAAAAAKAKPGKPGKPAKAKGKQITGAQLVNRISLLITAVLIGGVVLYALEYFLTK
jgi:hypothetical protein